MHHMSTKNVNQPSIASMSFYHILSFILSIIYFVLVVTLISLGVGTVVIWIGVPILIFAFAMIRGIAAIERSMARDMLGAVIPTPQQPTQSGFWARSRAMLADPLTWKSLLYVFIKFPLSIFSFVVTVTLLSLTLGLLLAPLGYMIATFVLQIIGIQTNGGDIMIIELLTPSITGNFDVIQLLKSMVYTLVGIAFWYLTSYLMRGLSWISAELARVMLSPTDAMHNSRYDTAQDYQRQANTTPQQHTSVRRYDDGYTQPRATYQEQVM